MSKKRIVLKESHTKNNGGQPNICLWCTRTGSVQKEHHQTAMMLVVTFTALIQKTVALVKNVAAGQAAFLVDGLQLIVAILLMVLGVMVAYSCIRKLFGAGKNSEKEAA